MTDSWQQARAAFAMIADPDAAEPVKVVATGAPGDHARSAAHHEIGLNVRELERALRFAGWSRREAVADAGRLARQLNEETQWT
jgi:hypothetical protein